jgi:cytochrome o ubiquinol oxidase subunit II
MVAPRNRDVAAEGRSNAIGIAEDKRIPGLSGRKPQYGVRRMRVLILGATGLVGRNALAQVLAQEAVTQVLAPTRKPLAKRNKLVNPVAPKLEQLLPELPNWRPDGVICTTGTTIKKAGSKEAFRSVDHDLPLAFARQAYQAGAQSFALVSAIGASADSSFFYPKVKGELEQDIRQIGFRSLTILRPGMIEGARGEFRLAESIALTLSRFLAPVLPKRFHVNPAPIVALALVDAILVGEPGCHFRYSDSRRGRQETSGQVRADMSYTLFTFIGATLDNLSQGVLVPRGPIASAERLLLINSTAIMLVVVIPVIVATLAFAWWYRSSNTHASRSADESYEGRLEFVLWSIPMLTVILLGGVIWIGSHQLDPRAPIHGKSGPLRVQVVSLDWKWLFVYPDQGVAAVNQLIIPVETPVEFQLTSATVMNSFFVPQLGGQIYTMGGMITHLSLLADAPGQYPGFSANFSGDGFSDMRFVVKSVPVGDFNAWLEQVRGTGSALDNAGYTELAKPTKAAPPITYRFVEPNLFERIVDKTAAGSGKMSVGGAYCRGRRQARG